MFDEVIKVSVAELDRGLDEVPKFIIDIEHGHITKVLGVGGDNKYFHGVRAEVRFIMFHSDSEDTLEKEIKDFVSRGLDDPSIGENPKIIKYVLSGPRKFEKPEIAWYESCGISITKVD